MFALIQAQISATPSVWEEFWRMVVSSAGPAVTAVLLALAGLLAAAITKLGQKWTAEAALAREAGRAHLTTALGGQLGLMGGAVLTRLNAEVGPVLTQAMADGEITPEERAKLQAVALQALKDVLGEEGQARAAAALGITVEALEPHLAGWAATLLGGLLAHFKIAPLPESPPAPAVA